MGHKQVATFMFIRTMAVTRIFFGGCHVELERRRREDRRRWDLGRVSPPQKIFAFLFQNGEFLCMPVWISVWYFFTVPQPENVLLNK